MNHTPGPWRAEINVNENARLIAAAPDMLSELIEFCRDNCDTCTMRQCHETCGLKQAKELIERVEKRPIREVLGE